jgi:phospholipase/lecithinase/hemolysin
VAAALLLATSNAWGVQLLVFGDSLSDSGNWGHESNGPLWVENLATMLGGPTLVRSLSGGTNFAYAGAKITGAGASVTGRVNSGHCGAR